MLDFVWTSRGWAPVGINAMQQPSFLVVFRFVCYGLSVVLCHLVWGRAGMSEHLFSLSPVVQISIFPRSSSSDIASQLITVRAELAALQRRYDDLHADRDRLAHKLEENMRKYKRFKRWVFTRTLAIPPKGGDRVTSAATPHPQPQMLETPITHKSSFFASFYLSLCESCVMTRFQNPAQVVNAPQPNLSPPVQGGALCHPADASSILHSTL